MGRIRIYYDYVRFLTLILTQSKVWISHDKSKLQLAYFQAQITSLECAPFDYTNQVYNLVHEINDLSGLALFGITQLRNRYKN